MKTTLDLEIYLRLERGTKMINNFKYRVQALKMTFQYAKGIKKFFVFACIASGLIMLPSLTVPMFYQFFIKEIIFRGNISSLYIVINGYLGTFILGTLFSYIKLYCENQFGEETIFRIRYKIWKNMFLRDFESYETQSTGDMNMRISVDLDKLKNFVEKQFTDYITSILTFIITTILLFTINPLLALFASIVVPVTFWLSESICKREQPYVECMRDCNVRFSDIVHESAHNWREIKALRLERQEKMKFLKIAKDWAYANSRFINFCVLRVDVLPKIQNEFIMQFLLYFIGGLFILKGKLTISELLVFSKYYDMLSEAVKSITWLNSEFQEAKPHIDKVIEELSISVPERKSKGLPNDKITSVRLDNAHFQYPDTAEEVVKSISLKIKEGQRVAIVGHSGCGKSTTLKLITGLLKPSMGNIYISGQDIEKMDLDEVHKKIGFIMQDNILFNDSIKENLLYGKADASDEEIYYACKKASILDFVISLPSGFNTVIGERGIKLSGGQKQRIVLARTFLRNPDLYIFDEATSALDQYSENIIYDAMRAIDSEKTVIVVAHRESSIELCNIRYQMIDGTLKKVM